MKAIDLSDVSKTQLWYSSLENRGDCLLVVRRLIRSVYYLHIGL